MEPSGIGAVLQDIQTATIVILALVALRLWQRHRGGTAAWVAVAFAVLGLVVLVARFLPQPAAHGPRLLVNVLIALIVLFPYALFRFAASFAPASRAIEVVVGVLTGIGVAVSLVLPPVPAPGEPRPGWFRAFLLLLVAQWVLSLGFVSVRMWRAGTGEVTVIRRRVRLLSLASAGLGIAIVVSASADTGAARMVNQVIVIVSAGLFLLGFAPPRLLRVAWRIPETETLRSATAELMQATTADEVTDILLPQATRIIGGRAAALVDAQGGLVAFHGEEPAAIQEELARSPAPAETKTEASRDEGGGLIRTRAGNNILVVWGSPWTPFFGREEMALIRSLGSLAGLALERAALFAQERQFIANASHEMRTPLTAISGIADTLAKRWSDLPEDTRDELLEAIGRQGERARLLIQNLLDLSKIGAESSAEIDVVEVRPAVDRVVEVVPSPPGVTLDVEAPRGLAVLADSVRLEQILANLLSNAYRYGGPRVTVRATSDGPRTTIEVEDDGGGVDPAFVPSMFDPFTRGEDPGATGSGLGLAICRRLAESFGARLQYRPRRPNGAVFSLTMEAAR